MPPAHAAVIHAVLVDRGYPGIEKHLRHLAHALEDGGGDLLIGIVGLEAHDANVPRAQALHSRQTAPDFAQRQVEWVGDLSGPVHDRRTKTIHGDTGLLESGDCEVEGLVGNVVEVGLRETWHFDSAHLQMFPAQFLRSLNLGVERIARLVADTCQNHTGMFHRHPDPVQEFSQRWFRRPPGLATP